MRNKSWPYLEAWREIFGKDRATGESAEDILDAVNELEREENTTGFDTGGHHNVSYEDYFDVEGADENISQSNGCGPTSKTKREET